MELPINPFREALETLDRVKADAIFQTLLQDRSPIQAVEEVVVPALEQIGAAWNCHRFT